MRQSDLPKVMMQAVGHKAEWGDLLLRSNFVDVLAKLFFALASIAGCSLRFDYRKDRAVRIIQAVIGKSVPGCRVVTGDGYFELYLRAVAQIPPGFLHLRVCQESPSFCFIEIRHI